MSIKFRRLYLLNFLYICALMLGNQLDIAVIGVGNRARKYLSCLPPFVRVRCLVEPDPLRLEQTARRFGVPPEGCFRSADEFFAAPRQVAAVIVAAPDRLHVPLSLRAVRSGMHVLLEKPVAASGEEYLSLMDAAASAGVHVGVCLEMRFHPYFRRIKEILDEGMLGRLVAIDHTEHIGPDRMAHTFVRGLWSRRADAGPIFLSKCCHDADFIVWATGAAPVQVKGKGSLEKFRNDPFAPAYCIDCGRSDCPYNAVNLYRTRRQWIDGFDVPDGSTLADVIDAELRGGRYGRCVYRCDNDVYDTQDVEVLLDGGIPLHMHLEGTSMQEGRTTVIRGTRAVLTADGGHIRVFADPGELLLEEDYSALAGLPLHAGADRALVEDFFAAVSSGRAPSASLESALGGHQICWQAD